MENKRERFIRVAESRTNKAINMIRLIGNCASKNNYDYTGKEVQKIFNALENEIRIAKNRFLEKETANNKFKL